MEEVIQTMEAYCLIENKQTRWRKLPNGKWICTSSNCSMCSGQYKNPPKAPKPEKSKFKYLKFKDFRKWKSI